MSFPAHQGGDRARASQVYGQTIHHGAYGWLVPSRPPSPPSASVEVVDTAQPAADTDHDEQHGWTDTTIFVSPSTDEVSSRGAW
jgi:hypothetical protein